MNWVGLRVRAARRRSTGALPGPSSRCALLKWRGLSPAQGLNARPSIKDWQLPFNLAWLSLLVLLSACSTPRSLQPANSRPFQFDADTFAYANELVWEYYYDDTGEWTHRKNESEPDYTHHCFVVARSARQFFQHARFDASQPAADEAAYRRLIREVMARDPARDEPDMERVLIPGYPDLRRFSAAHEELLKETCGGAMQSYFQRGHWRMIFPFSRKGQAQEADALAAAVRSHRPPVVHVVTFPKLHINHALLLFAVRDAGGHLEFTAYDPNQPEAPVPLTFDRTEQRFHFPSNDYWKGGALNVYEVYRAWNY
ncbi:MAG: hypothetical protein MUE94_13005 [Verrucomicrobia bacterium]|jgi:hypothetical protein|nr:hypothetical protein [Verrucomicrobiota bacterium]